MLKMGHLKTFLVTSAIFMVAYTRTTTEFRPAASGGCGTVTPIQVVVNPTPDEIDINKCMYIKTEISSFAIVPNATVTNTTAKLMMDADGFWGYY